MEQTSTILIVDDQSFGRETLAALLGNLEYRLEFARDGNEALTQATLLTPDLILLDVMMPEMDGFEVCRRLRQDEVLSNVPVIMVTALDDQDSRVRGIEAGADDFISKPFNRPELRARVRTITRLNRYRRLMEERANFERVIELSPDGLIIVNGEGTILLTNHSMLRMLGFQDGDYAYVQGKNLLDFVSADSKDYCSLCLQRIVSDPERVMGLETTMMRGDLSCFPVDITSGHIVWGGGPAAQVNVRDVTERKFAEEQVRRSREELAHAYHATLEGWSRALELRDKETEGHSQRVTEMTVQVAQALGIEGEELEHIRRGALLHDVGKMGIPDSILLKPGALTDEEWVIMRKHTDYAYEWLKPIEYLHPALDIPYSHHERWDGTGYPQGLQGEQIPLAARIFSVVDVWDALCSDRHYRKAWPRERVREHIQSLAGVHFDPKIVDIFLSLFASDEQGDGEAGDEAV